MRKIFSKISAILAENDTTDLAIRGVLVAGVFAFATVVLGGCYYPSGDVGASSAPAPAPIINPVVTGCNINKNLPSEIQEAVCTARHAARVRKDAYGEEYSQEWEVLLEGVPTKVGRQ